MGEEDFIAAVSVFAGTYAPVNYALCQGQTVQVQQYQALYALVGGLFSPGFNSATFSLPNLANAVPVGTGTAQNGTVQTVGEAGLAAQVAFSNGQPSAAADGTIPTLPIVAATQTLGLNYAICLIGNWPQHP